MRKGLLVVLDAQPDREKPSVAAQSFDAAFREDIISPHARQFESVLGSRECCERHRGVERVEPCSACLSKCGTHGEHRASLARANDVRMKQKRNPASSACGMLGPLRNATTKPQS